jgi:hypothetical protein
MNLTSGILVVGDSLYRHWLFINTIKLKEDTYV